MQPLVLIPARGGSKGIPHKNIIQLGNKPLIQYTVEEARKIFPDENICVSTDDLEIKSIVENLGLPVPFLRPAELATDTCGTKEVILHAIKYYQDNNYNFDTFILLQATSPYRTAIHIQQAMDLFKEDPECDLLISVQETKANPYFTLFEEDNSGYLHKSKPEGNIVRRQDCPKVYEINGAIYIYKKDVVCLNDNWDKLRIRKYLMDKISSIDIDDEFDLLIAEFIYKIAKF